MHMRGVTKRMEKGQETEEDRREEETEAGTDIGMEQQASNTEAVSYTHLFYWKRVVIFYNAGSRISRKRGC